MRQRKKKPERVARDADDKPTAGKVHSLSRAVASKHGANAAALLQYLAHHVSKSRNLKESRKWFYITLDELANVFPYIKRSTIHDTVNRLAGEGGPLMIREFNKKRFDRTCWYSFRDQNARKQAQSNPVYYRADEAEE